MRIWNILFTSIGRDGVGGFPILYRNAWLFLRRQIMNRVFMSEHDFVA